MSVLFTGQWDRFPIPVDAEAILARDDYWAGAQDQPHLATALPAARQFLEAHRHHHLVFGDAESFIDLYEAEHDQLEWLDLGSLTEPAPRAACLEPRYFAEHPALRYTSWSQVEEHCKGHYCGWSGDAAATAVAEQVFARTVQRLSADEAGSEAQR